jgi:hypothetical protein
MYVGYYCMPAVTGTRSMLLLLGIYRTVQYTYIHANGGSSAVITAALGIPAVQCCRYVRLSDKAWSGWVYMWHGITASARPDSILDLIIHREPHDEFYRECYGKCHGSCRGDWHCKRQGVKFLVYINVNVLVSDFVNFKVYVIVNIMMNIIANFMAKDTVNVMINILMSFLVNIIVNIMTNVMVNVSVSTRLNSSCRLVSPPPFWVQ